LTRGFVDSGAWLAMMVQRDANHRRAREFFRTIATNSKLVTSNYVIGESYTWLAYNRGHRLALELRRLIADCERLKLLTVAWVTPDVHERAWDIFRRFDDQTFSFCDCTSFVVARDEAVDFVFGFDNDFVTMGFDLRPSPA
jgi:predicted nucleic acid-binding protein